jgi:hypothetical protein
MSGHLTSSQCVRFHPNGLYVATGSSDRTCRLWDVQRGTCVRVFPNGHSAPVSCIAFSPDGRYLASGGELAEDRLDEFVNFCCRQRPPCQPLGPLNRSTHQNHAWAHLSDSVTCFQPRIRFTGFRRNRRYNSDLGRPFPTCSTRFDRYRIHQESGLISRAGQLKPWRSQLVDEHQWRCNRQFGRWKDVCNAWDCSKIGGRRNGGGRGQERCSKVGFEVFLMFRLIQSSPDLLGLLLTKRTPITSVKFTEANLLIALGSMRKAA